MSTVIAHPTRQRSQPDRRLTAARVARSEWTKLRTLRSTRYSLLAALVMTAALPVIVTASRWNGMSVASRVAFDPVKSSLDGIWVAQLAIAVLGVLVMSGEYATGMIRSTLAAVPKRLPALAAKAAVFTLVTFTLSFAATLTAFFSVQTLLGNKRAGGHAVAVSFFASGVARAVIGGAVYLAAIGLFGLGVGAIVRNTAAGISAVTGIIFVTPWLIVALPSSVNAAVSPYLPSSAGQALMSVSAHDPSLLSPWQGTLLLVGYVAAVLVPAAVLLRSRDA